MPLDCLESLLEELVRHDEHECCRTFHCLPDVRDGYDVIGELEVGEVLDVLVGLVDDISEVTAVDLLSALHLGVSHLLLEDPHWDAVLKDIRVLADIVASDTGDCRAPGVSRAIGRRPTSCPIQ